MYSAVSKRGTEIATLRAPGFRSSAIATVGRSDLHAGLGKIMLTL